MPISMIVGPPNSGRLGEVVRRLRAQLDREPVLLVPRVADADRFERALCADGAPVTGVSIRTFAWLLEDLAAALALAVPPLLSAPERLALARAATREAELRLLRRSAERPGFAPALVALIEELEAALIPPTELADAAAQAEGGEYEAELARLYAAYVSLRDRAGRADLGSLASAVLAQGQRLADAWGSRPLFVYGFDDLTRAQLELLRALSGAAEVTVAATYDDREALAARAPLIADLQDLGAELELRLEHDPGYSESPLLAHIERNLFEPEASAAAPDDGLVLLESAGGLGEAEAIGVEVAKLLATGAEPDDVVIVVRRADASGPLLGRVLARFGVPAAVEAAVPLARTAVGASLVALCRAAAPDATPRDLLAHLRHDPAFPAGIADALERRIARGEVHTLEEAWASWERPPRHLERLRAAPDGVAQMEALARSARELAQCVHRRQARLAGHGTPPLEPVELRAGDVAAALARELAAAGSLAGCAPPTLADAIEAIRGARVPLWRGPTEGRVCVLGPQQARSRPARYLFCAGLCEGEFPAAAPRDPLLGEDRRARLGLPALRRADAAAGERYLFHACVARPTRRLYLSWRSADDDGGPLACSPFVDDVLDLVDGGEGAVERRRHGLEHAVLEPADAPTPRELARALAARGLARGTGGELAGLELPAAALAEVRALLDSVPDPWALPGPLTHPGVLASFEERRVLSSTSLEGWAGCSYRWFIEHELAPERLEPTSDPLWIGGAVHKALKRLYADPPGDDAIPRPGDLERWQRRFAELLEEEAMDRADSPERAAALARARAQVDAFLAEETRSEAEFRPRPDLLEARFGFEGENEPSAPPLELGDGLVLRGSIDRIDLAPDGVSAVIRDYKTARKVPGVAAFEREGALQAQLYALAARECMRLKPIASLYQPLGATDKRGPRGMAVDGDERLQALGLTGTDYLEPGEFRAVLDAALDAARRHAARMRAGDIRRDPAGGECPRWCRLQAICRKERAFWREEGGDNGGGAA